MKFIILHPEDGSLNTDCNINIRFKIVAVIEAEGVEYVFNRTQNDSSKDYAKLGLRSTSVGDMFMDIESGKSYIIEPRGHGEVIIHAFELTSSMPPLI